MYIYIHLYSDVEAKVARTNYFVRHLMNLNSSLLRCELPLERGFTLIWILRRSKTLTFYLPRIMYGWWRDKVKIYTVVTLTRKRKKQAKEAENIMDIRSYFRVNSCRNWENFEAATLKHFRSLLHSHIYYRECSGSLRVLLTTPTTTVVSSHGPKVFRWSPAVLVEIPNTVRAHTRHVNIARSFALCFWHRVSIFSQEVIWMARYRSFPTIRGNKASQYLRKHNVVQYENRIIYFISLYWVPHVLKYTIMSRIFQKYANKQEKIFIKYDIFLFLHQDVYA